MERWVAEFKGSSPIQCSVPQVRGWGDRAQGWTGAWERGARGLDTESPALHMKHIQLLSTSPLHPRGPQIGALHLLAEPMADTPRVSLLQQCGAHSHLHPCLLLMCQGGSTCPRRPGKVPRPSGEGLRLPQAWGGARGIQQNQ